MHVGMYACMYACMHVCMHVCMWYVGASVSQRIMKNMFLSSIVPGEIMSGFEDRVRVWGVVFRG